nr:hypothetical protein [Tanacetum cinerariifolium]
MEELNNGNNVHTSMENNNASQKSSYANVDAMHCNVTNKLETVPTFFENGNEVVHEDDMSNVFEQSPWLVNGKPLVVQKWDPNMNIVKSEPKSIPTWVKMYNVPLEAWNVKGISAIASRVGKPVMMDQVTANMCHSGVGRLGYARVLVETDAEKGYTDKIEIIYRDVEKNIKRMKFVDVDYAWKPLVCSHRLVFGHGFKEIKKRTKSAEEVEKNKHQVQDRPKVNGKQTVNDGFSSWNWKSNKDFDFGRVRNKDAQSIQGKERNEKSVIWCIDLKRRGITRMRKEKGNDSDKEEDVIEVNDKATSNLVADEIKGHDGHNCIGWDPMVVKLMIVHESRQSILCEVENVATRERIVSSFVYAANTGTERKELWIDLRMHKRIVGNKPWMLLGDFNVILKHVEHSTGSSVMTSDMQDFHELDRLMINEAFMDKFENAHEIFLIYMASDHSPDVLCIPDKIPKTKKSFKISNFVANKKEFREITKQVWEWDVYGCHMTSSLHDKSIQAQKNPIDNPYHAEYRSEAAKCYEEYTSAAEDEMKLLQQQAKIKWLSEGDKNSAYFHSTLKARRHKNRIETICDENGFNFVWDMVAEPFVKHFKNLLGEAM